MKETPSSGVIVVAVVALGLVGAALFWSQTGAEPSAIAPSPSPSSSSSSTPAVTPLASVATEPAVVIPAAVTAVAAPAAALQAASPASAATTTAPRFQTGDTAQRQAASADAELLAVRGMLRDYRATFGQNPVGTNREITRALLGNNPRGVRFSFQAAAAGAGGTPRLDDRGQLLDRWGRPYFFHQISGTALEVRSAGPDGVMWNADDEVTR